MKDDEIKINVSFLKKIPKHKWAITTYILSLAIIIILFGKIGGITGNVINENEIKPALELFINNQLVPGENIKITEIKKESGLYVATALVDGQNIPVYVTQDGKFITQGEELLSINKDFPINAPDYNSINDVELDEDDDAFLGDENAPIVIIEFSDYQCPFCNKFYEETLPLIKKNYIDTNKVKLVYRDFPLEIHPQAQKSAEAAECTRDEGGNEAYFKFHNILFENQASLSESNYKKWAAELGFKIDSCLDSGEKTQEVLDDLEDGISAGVSGTPTFFINGNEISGAQPYSVFETQIEGLL